MEILLFFIIPFQSRSAQDTLRTESSWKVGRRLLLTSLSFVKECTGQMVGIEWCVDARGCAPDALRDQRPLLLLCQRIITDLELHVVGEERWHQFPHLGGWTALFLLTESHLACHTYPEFGIATFNLYCCRERARWPWEAHLRDLLAASEVSVQTVLRGVSADVTSQVGCAVEEEHS